jgi:uncharacterized protein (TIGR01777 family)
MRWVLAGASGYLGTKLTESLRADGHEVVRLVRRQPAGRHEVEWDPYAGELDPGVLADADVVVNLAGANIGRPWTPTYKKVLRESRVRTTATLSEAVAKVSDEPPALLVQSGKSAYGEDRGDEILTEETPTSDGFLADVCRLWAGAAEPAEKAGARVAHLRTGLVLAPDAIAFRLVALPFRLGLGGRLGSGRQYMATISLTDWVAAVRFVADDDELSGPVNLSLPEAPTNAEFTKTLAAELNRPAIVPVPGLLMRAGLNDLAWEFLGSIRMVPRKLLDAGFTFTYPDVEDLVRQAVHG